MDPNGNAIESLSHMDINHPVTEVLKYYVSCSGYNPFAEPLKNMTSEVTYINKTLISVSSMLLFIFDSVVVVLLILLIEYFTRGLNGTFI